jgi:O-antigen/teichoic acid export membrane protein
MLLVSPMLVLFQMLLPILLPALYTGKFMPALGMMQVMVIAMFIRAVKLPISYLPLARGDSRSYLLMEGCYDVVVVALVILGFRYYGLTGAGVGITLASVFDFFMLFFYMRWRYQYKMSATVVRYIALQLPLIIASFVLTLSFVPTAVYWLAEFVLTVVSAAISLRILHDKTHLWEKLTERWKRIWKK